jgi:hypothetical protein
VRARSIGGRVPAPTVIKSAWDLEFDKYADTLEAIGEEEAMKLDPLEFWPSHARVLPIHARLAANILSAPCTSANVERLFSLSRRRRRMMTRTEENFIA